MPKVDVEIFGGGIFGLATAWSCARRGASIRVIERHRLGCGASGGPVGALAPHAPDNWNEKKAFQLQSLLMAEDWWAVVADASGIDPGYARTGRIQEVPDRPGARELARRRARAAAVNWRGSAEWTVTEPEDAWHPHTASGLLIHDSLSARISPARALHCLSEALLRSGCEIVEGATESRGSNCKIWATGHEGLLRLNSELAGQVGRGEKGQALLLDHDARDRPQLFCDGIHVVPHADGTTAVGSTSERDFADPASVDEQLDALHAKASRLVPEISHARVIARWAGIRPRAITRAPLLGRHPLKTGHFIANGAFKIGFGIAPLVGECLAELVLSGTCRIPPDFLTENCLVQQSATFE